MALEMLEKLDDLRALDTSGMNLEVETQQGQSANDGEALPVESLLEQWGLATGSPSAYPCRARAQSAFIDTDDDSALAARFFLISGHRLRCH